MDFFLPSKVEEWVGSHFERRENNFEKLVGDQRDKVVYCGGWGVDRTLKEAGI